MANVAIRAGPRVFAMPRGSRRGPRRLNPGFANSNGPCVPSKEGEMGVARIETFPSFRSLAVGNEAIAAGALFATGTGAVEWGT
jgi:hypothetical protein